MNVNNEYFNKYLKKAKVYSIVIAVFLIVFTLAGFYPALIAIVL